MSLVDQTLRKAPPELRRVLAEVVDQRQQLSSGPYPDGVTPGYHATETAERLAAVAHIEDRLGRLTWRALLDKDVAQAYAQQDPGELRVLLLAVASTAVAWAQDIDSRSETA